MSTMDAVARIDGLVKVLLVGIGLWSVARRDVAAG